MVLHVKLCPNVHVLKGAEFVYQLKMLAQLKIFKPVENEKDIFAAEASHHEDFDSLLDAARKAVELGYRVWESIGQTYHVLLNMNTRYNGGRLAAEIKTYFEVSPQACEVLIFRGKQVFTVKRKFALQKSFVVEFRKRYR